MVPEPHDSDLQIAAATVNTGICSCLAGAEGGGNQSVLVFKAIDGEERMKTEWRRQFKGGVEVITDCSLCILFETFY